jgi:hypothetical protein
MVELTLYLLHRQQKWRGYTKRFRRGWTLDSQYNAHFSKCSEYVIRQEYGRARFFFSCVDSSNGVIGKDLGEDGEAI